MSQISVDSAHHVITHIGAEFADQKDSLHLQKIVFRLRNRLRSKGGGGMENVLADAGYSSGENYAFFERHNLRSYIPLHGQYKGGPKGFTYHKEGNHWECIQGKRGKEDGLNT